MLLALQMIIQHTELSLHMWEDGCSIDGHHLVPTFCIGVVLDSECFNSRKQVIGVAIWAN